MSDYIPTPYTNVMAHQLDGPIIQALLKAKHLMFSTDGDELIAHRNTFSVDTATTQELEWLGVFCNVPRPYAVIDDDIVLATDAEYKLFFKNVMALRQSQSLLSLAEVFYQFLPNGEFQLEIQQNGDIRIILDVSYEHYLPFLQKAAQSVYTASPQLQPFESRDYFDFIFDNGLYIRYIQMAQPNFWEFEYNLTQHKLVTNSQTLDALIVGFDEGQLVPDAEQEGYFIPRLSCQDPNSAFIIENGAIKLANCYITYKDENNEQQLNGQGLLVRKPIPINASSVIDYDVMYEPRDNTKPLPIEADYMAFLIGYDETTHALIMSNKRLSPTGYFEGKVANYGKQSIDRVERSTLTITNHKAEIQIFNIRRIATMNVTQEV